MMHVMYRGQEEKFIDLGDGREIPGYTSADYDKTKPDHLRLDRRGRGTTGKTSKPMTDGERQVICVLRGKGLTNVEIAQKLKRSTDTIARAIRYVEQQAGLMGLNFDWKEDLRTKSVLKLREAIVYEGDGADIYKAGTLAKDTLKGLGDLAPDNAVNINAMVAAVPEHMRDRYFTLETIDQHALGGGVSDVPTEEREDGGLRDAEEQPGA